MKIGGVKKFSSFIWTLVVKKENGKGKPTPLHGYRAGTVAINPTHLHQCSPIGPGTGPWEVDKLPNALRKST